MSGTDRGRAARSQVVKMTEQIGGGGELGWLPSVSARGLSICQAACGTDVCYAATRRLRALVRARQVGRVCAYGRATRSPVLTYAYGTAVDPDAHVRRRGRR
eukprot:44158-Rhodomonas_salina.2